MTKPEGPAQEPQGCPTCGSSVRNVRRNVCMGNANPWHISVPATPVPKCKNCEQPKSAHLVSGHIYCPISLGRACWYEPVDAATPAPSQPAARESDQLITDIENAICYPPPHPDVSAEWSKRLKPLLEAWTAAKDTMYREQLRLKNEYIALFRAAERERDSLREANARLAADLNAALKARKDGQQ